MKNKISSLIVIIIFTLSFSFTIKQLCFTKNNKKEIKEKKEEKILTVIENKNSLYSILSNYNKEDYSYKKYIYETKQIDNNNFKQEIIENVNYIEELNNNGLKEDTFENNINEEKQIIIDDKEKEEIYVEIVNEEVSNKVQLEFESEELLDTKIDNNEKKNIIQILKEDKYIQSTEDVIESKEENKQDEIIKEDIKMGEEIIKEEQKNIKKNGFIKEDNTTYYYEDDIKVIGIKNIDGVNHYFNSNGKYLGINNIKVVDVSYYQGDINWDLFIEESDCYGVILRLGYYDTLDKKFERNISELKRLNIPYGIYLFSYSTTINGSNKEAIFTNSMIDKYDLKPTLGIYYDIESWNSSNGASSNDITKMMYDNIISNYIDKVSNHINNKYKVKVYSGRWYAMNRLGSLSKSYVDWVAEYNKTCKYDGNYSLWQYTSKGSVAGINGIVDISYIINN